MTGRARRLALLAARPMLDWIRALADQDERATQPTLNNVPPLMKWRQDEAVRIVEAALTGAGYFRDNNKSSWLGAIDRAIESLDAQAGQAQ